MRCAALLHFLRGASRLGGACVACALLSACSLTEDWLGGSRLRRLEGPETYPNAFRDVLGKTDEEIAAKIEASFDQLFYGDPDSEAIYFPRGEDQAIIKDIYNNDVRTEGIGLGMLITVQLNKREEFDRLWRYAKANLEYTSGAKRGYFRSWCNTADGSVKIPCLDSYGHQQFAMALIFAHNRWGSDEGGIDYEADALALLRVMRHKEEENGGVVDDVTNTFDAETKLVFDFPTAGARGISRPSNEMPGYYELWAQATNDPFWSEAAASGRAYLRLVAHAKTGLFPVRAYFNGTPAPYNNFFASEAYRTPMNLAIDQIWFGVDPWQVEEANRLLAFFSQQGRNNGGTYGTSYMLDGTPILDNPERALIVVNGITGLIATTENRVKYVQAAWDVEPSVGAPRYYSGLLHLISLLVLSGQFRVY